MLMEELKPAGLYLYIMIENLDEIPPLRGVLGI
jgi:hypothetical protein